MKKSELKNIIKECVKEVIFEEGVLSGIITEVAQGLQGSSLVQESKHQPRQPQQKSSQLLETMVMMISKVNFLILNSLKEQAPFPLPTDGAQCPDKPLGTQVLI